MLSGPWLLFAYSVQLITLLVFL